MNKSKIIRFVGFVFHAQFFFNYLQGGISTKERIISESRLVMNSFLSNC